MLGFLTSPTAETIVLVYVAYQLLSALVQSLPNPTEYGGIWYKAFYNFFSILIGDFKSYITRNPAFTAITTSSTVQPSGATTVAKTAITSGSVNQQATSASDPNYTGGDFIRNDR